MSKKILCKGGGAVTTLNSRANLSVVNGPSREMLLCAIGYSRKTDSKIIFTLEGGHNIELVVDGLSYEDAIGYPLSVKGSISSIAGSDHVSISPRNIQVESRVLINYNPRTREGIMNSL